MREQVFARDGYSCSVPGCRRTWGLDIHHIQFQEHGGGHELSNLTLICSAHHAALHREKLVIEGRAPHALVVTFPRGHAIESLEDLEAGEPDLAPVPEAISATRASHVEQNPHPAESAASMLTDPSHGPTSGGRAAT